MIGRSSPNILGQICQKWREIAFSTPTLWRGIGFSLDNGKRISQKLRLLELWLQRSASCLLSLNVHLGSSQLQHQIQPFLTALAAQGVRWEHLRLHSCPLGFSFPLIEAALPSLRSVYIRSKPARDGSASLASALRATPLLRTVALFMPHDHSITLYPWSQLTTFIGNALLPRQCVDVLSQALHLVHCRLYIFKRPDNTSTPHGVTLPCLSTFALLGFPSTSDAPWSVLDTLTLPALLILQVSEHVLEGDPAGCLKSLISRSNCKIQELCITHFRTSAAAYRSIVPMVGELTFDAELPAVHPFLVARDETSEVEDGSDDNA
ncbi:hypothetical protein C8R46DRAFT_1075949 [Mycena filopes]|nr:hypothetical protein C8R46DRAFT_1075949 [Mycena filopes]